MYKENSLQKEIPAVSYENQTPSKTIDNSVINALWHAIFDVLDQDGVNSIFSYANLPELAKGTIENGKRNIKVLFRILTAMRDLLQFSSSILLEMGRKFSFYFDPSGSNLNEFIEMLNKKLTPIRFSWEDISENEIFISMNANADKNKESLMTNKWLLYFYKGIFTEAILKAVGGNINITIENVKRNCCKFKITSDHYLKS